MFTSHRFFDKHRLFDKHRSEEQGDVPGWVMIVVMSAGLVALLAAAAGPRLQSMLDQALSAVGG